MIDENCKRALAAYAGRTISVCGHLSDYGDRIQESQQVSNEQQTQQADDPSGPGWRDVEVGEVLQPNDMMRTTTGLWLRTTMPGRLAPSALRYRRRIEQQPSPDNLLNEIQVLIDLLRGVQDWSGTRVGDAIDVIEAQLFRRKVGQKNV